MFWWSDKPGRFTWLHYDWKSNIVQPYPWHHMTSKHLWRLQSLDQVPWILFVTASSPTSHTPAAVTFVVSWSGQPHWKLCCCIRLSWPFGSPWAVDPWDFVWRVDSLDHRGAPNSQGLRRILDQIIGSKTHTMFVYVCHFYSYLDVSSHQISLKSVKCIVCRIQSSSLI